MIFEVPSNLSHPMVLRCYERVVPPEPHCLLCHKGTTVNILWEKKKKNSNQTYKKLSDN